MAYHSFDDFLCQQQSDELAYQFEALEELASERQTIIEEDSQKGGKSSSYMDAVSKRAALPSIPCESTLSDDEVPF